MGYLKTPGRMPWGDGEVEIEPRHIAIWEQHPNAVFTIVLGTVLNSRRVYILGGWTDAGDPPSP